MIYIRAATSDPLEGIEQIDRQLSTCQDYAAERGWEVVSIYADIGESGNNLQRRGLEEMLYEVLSEADIVLVSDVSRLARNLPDFVEISHRMQTSNTRLRVANQVSQ